MNVPSPLPRAGSAARLWLLLVPVALLGAAGCRVTSLAIWGPIEPPSACAFEVERVRDIAYCDDEPRADTFRHQLDLYLPKGKKDFPVVVLVHGGAWVMGDNRCCGLYSSVGEFLASQGVGVAMPNYRLSPEVRHPEHVKDVARAVAWTYRHVGEYGGRPDQLFLAGHSAGGHLVSLLATDETYLKAEGLRTADIKGVMAVSGVYRIAPGVLEFTLGGSSPEAFRFDELFPLRGRGEHGRGHPCPLPGVPMTVNVYGPSFGNDPWVRLDASPLCHVRPGLPPFLLFCAEKDLPTLDGMSEEFLHALLSQGCEAGLLRVANRNHDSVMFRAIERDDPVARAMLGFIRRHASAF